MGLLSRFSRRMLMLLRRGQFDADLDEEMRLHRELREREQVERGLLPEEAHYAAQRRFGSRLRFREESREMWGWSWLETFVQDIRYGLRQLQRNPGFTTVVVLSLALGIGANTAIFSVIDAVLIQSLPVKDPGRLVLLDSSPDQGIDSGDPYIGRWPAVSYDLFKYFVRYNESFQSLAAFRKGVDSLEVRWSGGPAQAELASGHLVSGDYFRVLGVEPAAGRVLTASDDKPNSRPVAVISYAFWQREFHGNRQAVGRSVDLNGYPFTIVGVTPPGFFGERMGPAPDFWAPLTFQPQIMERASFLTRKDTYWLNLIGRLKPGVSQTRAQAALDVHLHQYLVSRAGTKPSDRDRRAIQQAYIHLDSGRSGISLVREMYSEPLYLLIGIVGLVLLVACANVANLLLSRSAARQKEIAMRLTVGASRGRLIRQMLTESMLLAIFGGAAGLLVAEWAVRVLAALLSRHLVVNVATSPLVLAFTLAVSVLTGLIFGTVPALRVSRTELSEAVKGSITGGRSQSALSRALVALQVAVAVVLLVGAGLLVRTLVNLEDQYLGFRADNVLLVKTDPRLAGFKAPDLGPLYRQLLQRLNALPGVESATIAYYSPMSGHRSTTGVTVHGYTPRPNENMQVNENQVASNYFETLGIPVLLGRPIGPQDTATSPKVVVVNEAFVRRFLHGKNPIGRRVGVGTYDNPSLPELPQQIVGVVADARYHNPRETPQPFAYMPLSQDPRFFAGDIEVRTARDPRGAAAEIRQAIKDVDSALPVVSVETLRIQVSDRVNQPRLVARLSVLFSLLALILAAVGLYGVMAYWVNQRTHEIGVRMALGAHKLDVLRLVVGRGLTVTLIGLGCGLAAAFALARLLASSLYGVKPDDPLTLAATSFVVVAVSLLAAYIPARRAAKVDPMIALRCE